MCYRLIAVFFEAWSVVVCSIQWIETRELKWQGGAQDDFHSGLSSPQVTKDKIFALHRTAAFTLLQGDNMGCRYGSVELKNAWSTLALL